MYLFFIYIITQIKYFLYMRTHQICTHDVVWSPAGYTQWCLDVHVDQTKNVYGILIVPKSWKPKRTKCSNEGFVKMLRQSQKGTLELLYCGPQNTYDCRVRMSWLHNFSSKKENYLCSFLPRTLNWGAFDFYERLVTFTKCIIVTPTRNLSIYNILRWVAWTIW